MTATATARVRVPVRGRVGSQLVWTLFRKLASLLFLYDSYHPLPFPQLHLYTLRALPPLALCSFPLTSPISLGVAAGT